MAALVAVVFLGIPGRSQPGESPAMVKGELHSEAPVFFPDYRVELAGANRASETYRGEVQFDGSFELRGVPGGEYTLRVTTLHGEPVYQETVIVVPHAGPLSVLLPAPDKKPSAPGTISVTQLRHPPDRKAFQAVAAAQRFSASGQTEKAVEQLEKAIRISPEYAEAYNNRGNAYQNKGQYDAAIRDYDRAIALQPDHTVAYLNRAIALSQTKAYDKAWADVRMVRQLGATPSPDFLEALTKASGRSE